jgi:hypothetical protein
MLASNNDLSTIDNGRKTLRLVFILLVLALLLFLWRLALPADGWSYPLDISPEGQRFVTGVYYGREATALQPGDIVLEIDGRPIAEIVGDALTLQPTPPADWRPGGVATYLVERNGELRRVEVALGRRSLGQYARAFGDSIVAGLGLFLQILIAVLIFWRRPGHRAAQIFLVWNVLLLIHLLHAPFNGQNGAPAELFSLVYWPISFINVLIYPLVLVPGLAHIFLAFPAVKKPMRRRPRLTLLVIYGLPTLLLAPILISNFERPLQVWPAVLIYGPPLIFLPAMLTWIISLSHTLLTDDSAVTRAQARWLLIGMILSWGVGNGILFFLLEAGLLPRTLAVFLVGILLILIFPATLAITIFRYRLFDIDIVIRKTLLYGALTALLALVYFGSVVVLQQLFGSVTGVEQSPAAIVISTLAIAALFTPLRGRLQTIIDRRFYRQKYDAQQVLAQFAQTARDETDINTLTAELVQVVQETVQPTRISVWLKPVNDERPFS